MFSQRHGYEPLPRPMHLEEISDSLRQEIWNHTRRTLESKIPRDNQSDDSFDDLDIFLQYPYEIRSSIGCILGKISGKSEDRIDTSRAHVMQTLRALIHDAPFNKVLDLVELILYENLDEKFPNLIVDAFESHAAAYWLDISIKPYIFFPCSTESQGNAIKNALETIRENEMNSAEAHLRKAAKHINDQQYADSIADSIHAVESVARTIDPRKNNTLGTALESLEREGMLKHRVLKAAFIKLYAYTNTEGGIRHALLEKDSANVGLDEAMFMFGACASFAAYLTQKRQRIGNQQNSGT